MSATDDFHARIETFRAVLKKAASDNAKESDDKAATEAAIDVALSVFIDIHDMASAVRELLTLEKERVRLVGEIEKRQADLFEPRAV